MLSTARKCGSSFPFASSTAKYFWWSRITVTSTSSGRVEKLGIEAAENDGRKFRQIDDGRNQRLVFAPARSGDGASRRVERFADHLLTLGRAKNLGAAQRFDIGAGLGDGDGFAAGLVENDAMSAGSLARRECRTTPAARPAHPASPPASAPDERTLPRACANTCSSASRA